MSGISARQRFEGQLRSELEAAGKQRKLKELAIANVSRAPFVEVRGRELVDFTSWDLLNISEHPTYRAVLPRAVSTRGFGARSPRSLSGNSIEHVEAERRIARFMATESALLFSSKNQAILSLITALVSESDLVLCHEMVQGPVSDAVFLTGARYQTVPTWNVSDVERVLEQERAPGKRIVFLESVSPLTGESVDFEAILPIVTRHDALLVVDESFALGGYGFRGAGVLDGSPHRSAVFAWICDLSRAVAGVGSAVAASGAVCGFLLQRSRTFHHELPFPAPLLELNAQAIDLVELNEPWRAKLTLLSARLRSALRERGLVGAEYGFGPIISCIMKSVGQGATVQSELMQRGFLVDLIHPLAPRSDSCAVRAIVRTAHSELQLDQLAAVLGELVGRVLSAQP